MVKNSQNRIFEPTEPTASQQSSVTLHRVQVRGEEKFCVASRISGRRKREFFDTPLEARIHKEAILDRLETHGTSAFDVAPAVTVAKAWKEYVAARMPKLKEGNHTRLLEWWWAHFVAAYGTRPLAEIRALHIEAFLSKGGPRGAWSGTTANQGFNYLRLVFNWLVRYEFIEKNPVLKIDVPQRTAEHHLLSLADVARLLELTAGDDRLRAWLVLGVFGGMRQSEVGRALREHVGEEEILVPQTKSTDAVPRKRFVPILPVLLRHLPKKWDCLDEWHVKRPRQRLVAAMGWEEWPQNCLRHTAASMHLAMWQDSGKTAFYLGHSSPQMVNKTYARAVPQAEAKRFWGL